VIRGVVTCMVRSVEAKSYTDQSTGEQRSFDVIAALDSDYNKPDLVEFARSGRPPVCLDLVPGEWYDLEVDFSVVKNRLSAQLVSIVAPRGSSLPASSLTA